MIPIRYLYRYLPSRHFFATFTVSNPLTGKPCAQYQQLHTVQHMVKEKASLHQSRDKWSKLPTTQKRQHLKKFIKSLEQSTDQLSRILHESTGRFKPQADKEITECLAMLKTDLQEDYPLVNEKESGCYFMKPFENMIVTYDHRMAALSTLKYIIVSAIAGSSIVLKPQRYALPIAKKIEQIWRQANPSYPIIYCPVNNFADGLQFWIRDQETGFVSFSGDIDPGNSFYHFMATNSEIFAESEFLLTSSNSAYLLKDLREEQLKKVCQNVAEGCFSSGGTNYTNIKRVFVDEEIYDSFLTKFLACAEQYKIDSKQSRASPIITSTHHREAKERIKQLQQFKGQQLKILTQINHQTKEKAMFVDPLIYQVKGIPNLNYWNQIYHLPICFVEAVSSHNSCIQKINESIFGLAATIYSNDQAKIEEIGRELQVGIVNGNEWAFSPGHPYSPRKRSGKGSSFSSQSFGNAVKSKSLKGFTLEKK